MNIKDNALLINQMYEMVDGVQYNYSESYDFPLSTLDSTERTVMTITPMISGGIVLLNFLLYFSENARWQLTVNIYENDNTVPISTITSDAPSSAIQSATAQIGFSVNKSFNTYTVTISTPTRQGTVVSGSRITKRYNYALKNIFDRTDIVV